MKKGFISTLALLASLLLFLAPAPCHADETSSDSIDQGYAEVGAGYLGTSVEGGGETLSPYVDPDSHALFWFDLFHYFPSRTSVLLQGSWDGEDWYRLRGDLNWSGAVGFGFDSSRFPAFREHEVIPVSTDTAVPINTDDQDPAAEYRTNHNETTATLVLRVPAYPAHVRLGVRQYRVTGDRQMIFVDRNCTTECHVVSQTRPVDTVTSEITVETDAHLGWVDAAYTFMMSQFRDQQANPVYDYEAVRGGVRAAGPLEHDVYPEITTRQHTITLSTSNTGSLTAAAGLNLGRRTNDTARLALDYGTLTGQVFWRPWRPVSLVFNYRRLEKDEDVSDTVTAMRTAAGAIIENDSIESVYSGTLSYYPIRGVRFQGYYKLKDLERQSAASYQPDRIKTSTWKVSTQFKPVREMVVDLYYQHQATDHPLYITTPTMRTDRYAAVNLQPWTPVLLQLSFLSTRAKNDELGVWTGVAEAESDRENKRDLLQSGLTFTCSRPVTLSFIYSMFLDTVVQDLYLGASDALYASPDTPYSARGDQFMVQASWRPAEALQLKGDVSYLEAYGHYRVDVVPYPDLGGFTRFEGQQWRYALDGSYSFSSGWKLGTLLSYTSYDDQISAQNDEIIREIVVSVSKRW